MVVVSGFFYAAFNKVFRKASLSLMKEQVSRLAKSAASNIFSYFVSFSYTGERLILGFRRKDWILRAINLLLPVKSLWPHKLSPSGQIYSARSKLMLTSDQAKELFKKNVWMVGSSMTPLQNRWFTSEILNKSTVGEKFPCHNLYVESESFFE